MGDRSAEFDAIGSSTRSTSEAWNAEPRSNGKTETIKVKLAPGAVSGDSYTLQIEIAPEQIVIRDSKGKQLDRYERPNRTETVGKFGFKGDVALAIKKADER